MHRAAGLIFGRRAPYLREILDAWSSREQFVGRASELEQLDRALRRAGRQRRDVLVGRGGRDRQDPAGGRARAPPARPGIEVLLGRSIGLVDTEPPYQPFVEALRPLGVLPTSSRAAGGPPAELAPHGRRPAASPRRWSRPSRRRATRRPSSVWRRLRAPRACADAVGLGGGRIREVGLRIDELCTWTAEHARQTGDARAVELTRRAGLVGEYTGCTRRSCRAPRPLPVRNGCGDTSSPGNSRCRARPGAPAFRRRPQRWRCSRRLQVLWRHDESLALCERRSARGAGDARAASAGRSRRSEEPRISVAARRVLRSSRRRWSSPRRSESPWFSAGRTSLSPTCSRCSAGRERRRGWGRKGSRPCARTEPTRPCSPRTGSRPYSRSASGTGRLAPAPTHSAGDHRQLPTHAAHPPR